MSKRKSLIQGMAGFYIGAFFRFFEGLYVQYYSPLVDKHREYVDDISEYGRHLKAMTQDLLELPRGED